MLVSKHRYLSLPGVGEDPEPELFFDQQEVLSGAGADARAAMLDHFDALLDEPDSDQVEEVRTCCHSSTRPHLGPAYSPALCPAPHRFCGQEW